jgi:hypothetical protein
VDPIELGGDPLDNAAHACIGCIDLAEVANLALPAGLGNRDGNPQLRDIDSDKSFPIIRHGSSSCDEDRLGPPEQPSDAQCRASDLTGRGGHTVLRYEGKQEIEKDIFLTASVFTDQTTQSVTIGEAQHAVQAGLLSADGINELGAVINGTHPGRSSEDEITLFGGTGVGFQDLAMASAAVELALKKGVAIEVEF